MKSAISSVRARTSASVLIAFLVACGSSSTIAPAERKLASVGDETSPASGPTDGDKKGALGTVGEWAADVPAGPAPAVAGDVQRYQVPIGTSPVFGKPDALVTIVEFSEFQCPFCSRVLPTIAQIKSEYGDKVRFVWKNNPLPFHKNALPAAHAAMEANAQGKFWEFHDILFANQKDLDRTGLQTHAAQVGLDVARIIAALNSNSYDAQIKADQELANAIGARGTPNFFINGRQLTGAQPFEKFKEIIDDEVARATKLVAAGTDKRAVYATITRGALTEVEAPPVRDTPRPIRKQPDPNAVYNLPLTGDMEPSLGSSKALVTIVEFSDFQCPFCARVEPTMEKIIKEYGKDVRIVWMNNPLPFHKEAMPAAIAALEAYKQKGNRAFWKMHKKLFDNQRQITRANLEMWGKELRLNMRKFKAALDAETHKAVIEAQQAKARNLGASGTPSFFINGRNLRGAQPFAAFKVVIDEELAKAKDLVAAGTSRKKIYETIIADGATAQQFLPGTPSPSAAARPAANKIYALAVPSNTPSKGGKNAKVVIQQFSDFQCPFCGRVNPTLKKIMDEYGKKVRIVWRNYPLPFHNNAHLAAQASIEVFEQGGDAKFWAFHDTLFANQRDLGRAELETYASQLGGINMAKFKTALRSQKHKDAVEADMEAVKTAGARIGTPSFFINGKLIQGAQPFSAFKVAIDAALAGN